MAKSDETKWEFLKGKDDETNQLTLLHMLMMVFRGVDPKGVGSGQRAFFNKVLSAGIAKQTSVSYVTYLMTKETSDGLTKGRYDAIYTHLLGSKEKADEGDFRSLHEQYEKLKGLGKEKPEDYAKQLWDQMGTPHSAIDASYMDIFRKRSPWLFTESGLKGFDAEQTYKLLTVAIAISLNLKTSVTPVMSDPLDKHCKKFLYAGPPEELPEFTLREIFDTLFPVKDVFAVKRARDDDCVMVKWDELTEQDQLCILLPWLDAKYDLHPDSEEAAKALLDNNAVDKETADRLRGFFRSFSARPDPIWRQFVAHLKESLVKCRHAKDLQSDDEVDEVIDAELKGQLDSVIIPRKSKSYFNRLSQKRPWNNIARDKFWDGDQVDISLPEECKEKEDAEQIYRYIAAYVLIALCCVKADGDATPVKRKEFKAALIPIINKPNSEVDSALKDAYAKIDKLEQDLDKVKTDIAEKDRIIGEKNQTIAAIVALLNGVLHELHISSPIERREYIEVFYRRMGLTLDQIPEFDKLVNGYDAPKARRLTTDSADWGNGGIK